MHLKWQPMVKQVSFSFRVVVALLMPLSWSALAAYTAKAWAFTLIRNGQHNCLMQR